MAPSKFARIIALEVRRNSFHFCRVDTTDFNQDTPLHASLLYHNTENTKLLLEHGANLELTNTKGRKPIHNANDAESLELLLDHGAAINAQDANGKMSLFLLLFRQ